MTIPAILLVLATISNGGAEEIIYKSVKGYRGGKPYILNVSSIHQKGTHGSSLALATRPAKNFRDMMVAAAKDGFHLSVTTAFRTHREQRILHRAKGELAARPGHSSHQMGMSVDIAGTTRVIDKKKNRTILYWWLVRNAKRFGFYNDVEGETWHWTFYENGYKKKKKRTVPEKEAQNV